MSGNKIWSLLIKELKEAAATGSNRHVLLHLPENIYWPAGSGINY